ncbi:Uncharacterized conserved protein YdaU, DUF1376 family, partial [Hymenobacter psychrophilus]
MAGKPFTKAALATPCRVGRAALLVINMKAYSFYFNASDWLASQAVKQMSLAERGAYIGLLAYAWGADMPGTLPVNPDRVRRMAEMSPAEWEVSGEVLLEKFPLSECGAYRYNPRLLAEAAKQRELSEKNAENGRKSAERRAADKAAREAEAAKRQRKANENPTVVEINPTTVEKTANESSTKISQAKQSSYEDEGASSAGQIEGEKPTPKSQTTATNSARAVALTDPADEQHWSEGPLTKPGAFQVICERQGYEGIDFGHYRKQALAAAEDANISRTIAQWNGWIRNYLNNQSKNGPLLKAQPGGATLPSHPTPKHLLPKPGKETPGQVIYIDGVHDQSHDRMKAASYLNHWPSATIVSLAHPENPYSNA